MPLSASAAPPRPPTGQHAQKFEKHITLKLDYLLYLPADYNRQTDKKWPLILFLHGSGERGTDVNLVKVHGPPKVVETEPDSPANRFEIEVLPRALRVLVPPELAARVGGPFASEE